MPAQLPQSSQAAASEGENHRVEVYLGDSVKFLEVTTLNPLLRTPSLLEDDL
jgi:hypothetical protein